MRMFAIPNQSPVPMAYTQFPNEGGEHGGNMMLPGDNRDCLVDCMKELVKYIIIYKPHFDLFGDRCSERAERRTNEEKAMAGR